MIEINSYSSNAKERIKEEVIKLFRNFLQYKGYLERSGQTEMLSDVLDTILHTPIDKKFAILGAQAPTGTGKTFAYGFAVLSLFYLSQILKDKDNDPLITFKNNKVVISTVSIVLQDQLIRDIEDIDKYLRQVFNKNKGEVFSVARVVGKDNIVCPNITEAMIDGISDISEQHRNKLKKAVAMAKQLNNSGAGEELKFRDLSKDDRIPSQLEKKVCCSGISKSSCSALNAPCSYRNNYQNLMSASYSLNKPQIFLINHSLHNTMKKGLHADVVIFDEADMYNNKMGQDSLNVTNYLNQLVILKNRIERFIEETIKKKAEKLILTDQDKAKVLSDMREKLTDAFNLAVIDEKIAEASRMVGFLTDLAERKQQFLPNSRSSIFIGGNETQYAKINEKNDSGGLSKVSRKKEKKQKIVLNSNSELVDFVREVYNDEQRFVNADFLLSKFRLLLNLPTVKEEVLSALSLDKDVNIDYIKNQYNGFVDFYKKYYQSFDFLVKKIIGKYDNNSAKYCAYFDVTGIRNSNGQTTYNIVFRCDEVSLYNPVNIYGVEGGVIATSATLSKLLFNNLYKSYLVDFSRTFKFYSSDHNQQHVIVYNPHKGKHSIYNTDDYDKFLKEIASFVVNATMHYGNTSNAAIVTYSLYDKEKIEEYIKEILENNSKAASTVNLLSTKDYSMYEIIDRFKKKSPDEPNIISVFGMDGSKGIDLSNYSCSLLVSVRAPFPQPHNPAFYETQREYKKMAKNKVINDTISLLVQTGGRIRGNPNSIVVYALPYTEKKVDALMNPIIEEMELNNNNKIYMIDNGVDLNGTVGEIFDKIAKSRLIGVDNLETIGVIEKVITSDDEIFK